MKQSGYQTSSTAVASNFASSAIQGNYSTNKRGGTNLFSPNKPRTASKGNNDFDEEDERASDIDEQSMKNVGVKVNKIFKASDKFKSSQNQQMNPSGNSEIDTHALFYKNNGNKKELTKYQQRIYSLYTNYLEK